VGSGGHGVAVAATFFIIDNDLAILKVYVLEAQAKHSIRRRPLPYMV